MIHIEVDFQGDRSIETYSFVSTGDAYYQKLDELAAETCKIDSIKIRIGSDKVQLGWDRHPSEVLVDTSNVGIAIHKARLVKYPKT